MENINTDFAAIVALIIRVLALLIFSQSILAMIVYLFTIAAASLHGELRSNLDDSYYAISVSQPTLWIAVTGFAISAILYASSSFLGRQLLKGL